MPSKPNHHGRKTKGATTTTSSASSRQHSQQPSPLPHSPAQRQLPTPLPEDNDNIIDPASYRYTSGLGLMDHSPPTIAVEHDEDDAVRLPALGSSPAALIDFEAAASPVDHDHDAFSSDYDQYGYPGGYQQHPYQSTPHHIDFQGEQEDFGAAYRSPPFRQAELVDDEHEKSPSPLPTRPRLLEDDQDEMEDSFVGHTRSPTIPSRTISRSSARSSRSPSSPPPARSPVSSATANTLESLSRTIRSYTSAAAPPLVSRPVSFGRFSGQQQEYEREYEVNSDEEPAPRQHPYTSGVIDPVPERQRAWTSQQHRTTRSVSGGVGGLTQTLAQRGRVQYPVGEGKGGADTVLWAKWDQSGIGKAGQRKRLFLLLGYTNGLQIWDTTNLGSVKEILNINFDQAKLASLGLVEGSRILDAGVLPAPKPSVVDPYKDQRPLLGLLLRASERSTSTFALYSLKTHCVVSKAQVAGCGERFELNDQFVVMSTSSPPAISVLSALNLNVLHAIPASALASFAHRSGDRSSGYIPTTESLYATEAPNAPNPRPVFSLSGRLLAFASPPTMSGQSLTRRLSSSSSSTDNNHSPSSPGSATGTSSSPFSFALGLGKQVASTKIIPTTQAELGSAALKVGGSVLSGMRFLGGMAVEAAKKGMSASTATSGGGAGSPGAPSQRISRSAPTEGVVAGREELGRTRRRFSGMALTPIEGSLTEEGLNSRNGGQNRPNLLSQQKTSVQPSHARFRQERGYLIRVVDLSTLVAPSPPTMTASPNIPTLVAEFVGSRSHPISFIKFAPDGTTLYAANREGQVAKVFRVTPHAPAGRPSASALPLPATRISPAGSGSSLDVEDAQPTGSVVHLYDLRRGVTSAVIEGLEVLGDGQLAGVVTRNRTVHVFGVNPYGGKPDVGSHVLGMVKNTGVVIPPLHPSKVQVTPLVRVRGSKIPMDVNETPREYAPLAFTFIQPGDDVVLPPSLKSNTSRMPSTDRVTTSTTAPTTGAASKGIAIPGTSASPRSPSVLASPLLSARTRRPIHYQDALVFDSVEGTLYLQRIVVDSRSVKEGGVGGAISSSLTSGLAGMSLPALGGAGPLSRSVSSSVSDRSAVQPGTTRLSGDRGWGAGAAKGDEWELVGSVSVVATFNLQRGREWSEITAPMSVPRRDALVRRRGEEALAQAELSTFSTSRQVLPRSIYLMHQFSFHDLGEDYHALIRSYHLAITGTKIGVRKDVLIQVPSVSSSHLPANADLMDGFAGSPTSPRGMRPPAGGGAFTFDEPLASALAGELEFGARGDRESVLPMYPNGGVGAARRSLVGSIPIRGLGDGVTEGLGRIRKGIRTRITSSSAREVGGEMEFEFDEEENDDDFMAPRIRARLDEAEVVGHVDEDIWGETRESGWDVQDAQAVEDEEQFQAISKTISPARPVLVQPFGSTSTPISTSTVGSTPAAAKGPSARRSKRK